MDGSSRLAFAPQSIGHHVVATLRLAGPLAIALLAQMAMGVTDTVMLGSLGEAPLAAGGLAVSMFITTQVVLQGVFAAVSVLVSQARGAGQDGRIPRLYWTGMALVVLLSIPAFTLFSAAKPLLLLAGEPASLAADVDRYVSVLRWSAPGAMLEMGLLRAFLPAIGAGHLILWVTLASAFANAGLCYGLIHGVWGLPALGMQGAAMATVIVLSAVAVVLLALTHLSTRPPPLRSLGRAGHSRLAHHPQTRPASLGDLCRGDGAVPRRVDHDGPARPGVPWRRSRWHSTCSPSRS